MKKLIALLLALVMVFALAACAPANNDNNDSKPNDSTGSSESTGSTESTGANDGVTVMSHADFDAAEMESEVVIETYVQAIESWYNGACHIYAASEDGGYYIYSYTCTEDEAAKLVPGTKIRVTGHKGEWAGEVEIMDAKIEILEGTYTATATDVTDKLGTDALADYMNDLVIIKGLTVAPSTIKDSDSEFAFLYSYDGSGEAGKSDLYFNVTDGTNTYTFTVNIYMVGTGADSDVYKAVEALKIGDKIDVEGFLYWYNGAQPHLTSVKPVA